MFKLTNPFRPFGIPKTATYLDEAYLGSSESDHAGLTVQHWEDRSTSGKGVAWDLFLQQTLLATLLKLLQMLALLCNITSSYVVTYECISHCLHQVCGLDPLLSMAKCIHVQDAYISRNTAFISRDTGFVHLR